MTSYIYANLTLKHVGTMHVSEGRVAWQTRNTTTDWHGNFEHNTHHGRMAILFDCKGRVDKLKSTVLVNTEEGVWEGYDYATRRIRLTRLAKWQFCHVCNLWHNK